MIKYTVSGTTKRTESFLEKILRDDLFVRVEHKAQLGVSSLIAATPKDSGLTASSWSYEMTQNGSDFTIWWSNSNVENGYFNVAVGLQLGHGTGAGAWVSGYDYINPALKPIFDDIPNGGWAEVPRA